MSNDVWEWVDSESAALQPRACYVCGHVETPEIACKGNKWDCVVLLVSRAVAEGATYSQVERLLKKVETLDKRAAAMKGEHFPSSRRVQRRLLLRCLATGMPLLREDGRPRGKAELQSAMFSCAYG
jgi:hypothetical protein